MRALLTLLALVSLPVPLSVLAAGLNDTGVTQCTNGGASLVACDSSNTGNSAAYPRQDARFGRDAAQAAGKLPAKTGGGAAGFDFTPLNVAGNAIAITSGVPASTPACIHDNVTNLTWEVKTAANMYDWYDFAAASTYASDTNIAGLCVVAGSNPWRVPSRRELLSIVHHGVNSPAIDPDYFPNTDSNWFWTSDIYAPVPANAWGVVFYDGYSYANYQSGSGHVRLVRSGQ